MLDSSELKAALERLLGGEATEDDRGAVRAALVTGALVTGERAVAIGGNATDVIIATGDHNVVLSLKGVDTSAVQEILSSIALAACTNFRHRRVTLPAVRKN